MHCPSCASEVPDGSRFCPSCGHLLVQTEERRIVTVLFADLVGFTGLSEGRDPEELKPLIDRVVQGPGHGGTDAPTGTGHQGVSLGQAAHS